MAEHAPALLTLFDFDGTLCRLGTDYARLRVELGALAAEAGITQPARLFALAVALRETAVADRAEATLEAAEFEGLSQGEDIPRGIALYRERASTGRVAIVSHNSRPVIEAWLNERGLPDPDTIFDRTALSGSKETSPEVRAYVSRSGADRVSVVGDSEADCALARALGACFEAIE